MRLSCGMLEASEIIPTCREWYSSSFSSLGTTDVSMKSIVHGFCVKQAGMHATCQQQTRDATSIHG